MRERGDLIQMVETERFDPPPAFVESALWSDPSIYEQAEADPEAWWRAQATELLDWHRQPGEGLNCFDRHVEAGDGDRVAYFWRGEEGEEREAAYAELCQQATEIYQRLAEERGTGGKDSSAVYRSIVEQSEAQGGAT